jgi:uncharacterized damage-inducible protein DinB
MPGEQEIELFWRYIKGSVDNIIKSLEGLDEADMNWKPLDNANSLYVLAVHTIANVEENILGGLCGLKVDRRREEEFQAKGNSFETIQKRWQEVQKNISSHLGQISPGDLEKEYEHPRRGKVTGRDLLIVAARHAAEHMGHAELTRDLLFKARGRAIPYRKY